MSDVIKLGISPKELLKAANSIKGQFVNKKGIFDAAAFATQVGVSLNQKNGFITEVVQDRKTKKLKLRPRDEGAKYSQWMREQAQEIPPEVEKLLKGMPEGDTLWPLFQEWVAEGLKESKANAVAASQPGWQIDQGHIREIGGDRSGSGIMRNPHVGGNIYNEPKRSRNFDNRDRIIGNIRRNVKPELHADPKDIELSGGQIANDWQEVIAQFLTGSTGTNVEYLSQEALELARDEGMSLQQAAAIQDRKDQLSQQFSYSSGGSIKAKDFMTNTEAIMTKKDIFKRPDNFFGKKSEADIKLEKDNQDLIKGYERSERFIQQETQLINETLPAAAETIFESTVGQIPIVKAGLAGKDIGEGNIVSGALRLSGMQITTDEPLIKTKLTHKVKQLPSEIEAVARDIAGKNY